MYFIFEKVNDYNLIAPAINTIYSQNSQFVSTSKLIDSLRIVSLIPSEEKEILMNRSDDKFSQKIRNLISHKVLENYNLAEISKNKIELTNHGKRLGKFIESKLKQNQKININELNKEENFLNNLLMAKLNINFNPFLFTKLDSCDFSTRAMSLFHSAGLKYVGDLITDIDKDYLIRFPNSGKKTLNEIEEFLSKKNLSFGLRTDWSSIENKQELSREYQKLKTKDIDFNLDILISSYINQNTKETDAKFERKKKILTNRFAINGDFLTLEELGEQFGVTRERIRQIQSTFSSKIKNKADIKFAIRKLINFISKQTPILEQELSKLLIKEKFFNQKKDISSLRSIIDSFDKFKFDNFQLYPSNSDRLKKNEISNSKSTFSQDFLTSSKKEEKTIQTIVIHSRKWTTKHSFCNFNKLINNLFKTRNYSSFLNIKNSLKKHENFLWFDDNNFMALDTAGQIILNRLRKLLFIHKKIRYEDFIASLLNDYRIGTAPPKELLQKICKANNFQFDENYVYFSGEKIEFPDLEGKIIKLFKDNGNFLTFWECINLSEKYNIVKGSLAMMMYGSYLVRKLDEKIFCLFGTEIDQEKILLATERSKKEKELNSDVGIDINWTKDKKVLVDFNLTNAIKLRGYVYINAHWNKILEGSFYSYELKDYIKVGHAIWNIKELISSHKANEKVTLEFTFNPSRIVKLLRN